MTTVQKQVPPSAAFRAAGPIMREGQGVYASTGNLPQAIKVEYFPDRSLLALTMGFGEVKPGEDGDVVQGETASGETIEVALARSRQRVAYVNIHGLDIGSKDASELMMGMLSNFLRDHSGGISIEAEATLRLLIEMAPRLTSPPENER